LGINESEYNEYVSMIHFKDDDFEAATATTADEAKEATRAGFEFANENKGVGIYEKQGSPMYKDIRE
jgi:hypothetical protein